MNRYAILDELSDGVQVIDENMRYVYLNEVLLRQINMTSEQIVGHAMTEKFPGIEHTEVYRRIHVCHQTRLSEQLLNDFVFPDGRRTFHELALYPVAEGVLIVSRDITRTKMGEALALQFSQNLFQFAHITSHDMREPIRRIQLLVEELVLDHASQLSGEVADIFASLATQSRSLMHMVDDFKHLADIGGADPRRVKCNIVQMAREMVLEGGDDTKVDAIAWPEDVQVMAVPNLLRLLLRRLFEDAFVHAHGRIVFSANPGTDSSPPSFVLSYPLDANRRRRDVFSPAGIAGLSRTERLSFLIMQKVVLRHQGSIRSDNAAGTFVVRFTLQPE